MNYHNITKCDMKNGDGLRVVLWVSGCDHHCDGCQNPQTWDPNSGLPFDEDAEKELFEALDNDYISGITFSGGDPFHKNNVSTVLRLAKKAKEEYKKNVWVYTGYTLNELTRHLKCDDFTQLFNYVDTIVDGRYEKEKRDVNYPWAGSTNQQVIDLALTNLKSPSTSGGMSISSEHEFPHTNVYL